MTTPALSSTRLFRTTLVWSGIATAALAVVGGVLGLIVAGPSGLWSALVAVLMAAVFLGFTAASILIANRWYGDPLFVPIFFGSVMGGWILKFVVFLVVLFLLRDQPWLAPMVFLIALVVSILVSLAIDVLVMMRMRVSAVSDTTLPTAADVEAGERRGGDSSGPQG
ncbi:hypothetical protein KZX37_08725 [Microbacterium sp. EYE_5]|uniref:hypothetical protein n=1 Tax=unclassified Microbacterium TaxID=2609290 RepID=UPI0020047287|nr:MULTISPECIES: hypothetical protein [unclassified Microbacterium]MCK6081403.1 hypothetical protein [Microbacterium sp. EYE_382]MCK6086673.1 hypothetical protein [Microbacterium sp. EYE_384]MCK6123829.1 hypothetical protein [Microbacterium sp. EYE_80]MCK6126738.1 hypothetical protein [Microbacterium sp. EYE_79]MCK6142358.1 hypothetical protein [Microbacterium sp. EYE_39]